MTRSRIWLPLWATLTLSACSTVPLSSDPSQGASASGGDGASAYALQAPPKRRSPSLVPSGPLQALTVSKAEPPPQSVATLEAPKDLWERMRRGFAMPNLDTDLVRDREQWYASRPDYLQRMTERGSKYLFHIVEELERRNLPLELALLPFIESAFNPQAVSSAKAAGMWQFMPATGLHFDLKQNAFRDDRRDVLASTRAALDYLERLHRMFGDWHLALAAYNWGEGNVARAIKRNEQAGLPTGYTHLRMPEETRYYVPKFQAVKNIVSQPERLGARLPFIGNHPFFDTATIERDMDVSLIAELAAVTEKDFRQLNPSHNKPVILAAGTPTVLLPWDNTRLFEERLKAHKGPLASWTVWRVPRNMTVAEAAKEHGLTEKQMRDMNRIPPRMALRAGATVLVPRSERYSTDVPEHIADTGQILLTPESQGRASKTVQVRKGDTLASIARQHKVSVANLRKWNGLGANAAVSAGQTLVIQSPARVAAKSGGGKKSAKAKVIKKPAGQTTLQAKTKSPATR
ncbi:transglycosylase SLT domain-containing protein [Hydrogenophaga aquatica]